MTDTNEQVQNSRLVDTLANQTLPFLDKKQMAFLGHLFDESNGLFKQIHQLTTPDWFSHPEVGKVYKILLAYYEKYKVIPNHVEFRENEILVMREMSETNRLQNIINECVEWRSQFRIETLRAELVSWMQAKIVQQTFKDALKSYNEAKWEDAVGIFKDAVKSFQNVHIEKDLSKKFSAVEEIAVDMGPDGMVPFGLGGIDQHLRPDCPQGGLRKGDTTLLIAPSNVGKTTVMLCTIAHNIIADNFVFLMTHEDTDTNIRVRLTQAYLSLLTPEEVLKFAPELSPQRAEAVAAYLGTIGSNYQAVIKAFLDHGRVDVFGWKFLSAALERMDKYCQYIPYNRGNMEIEDIVPIITKTQEDWKAKHGRGFDLFVCDYPAKVQTRRSSKGGFDFRHIVSLVYDQYVQLALEHKWHSIVAIQTNREGSKINKGLSKGENRLVSHEDVSEAWGPITTASNIITINRTPSAQTAHRVTFYLTKTRSAMTGLAISCKSDFERAVSHSDKLGWVSYYSQYELNTVCDMTLTTGVCKALSSAEVVGYRHSKDVDEKEV